MVVAAAATRVAPHTSAQALLSVQDVSVRFGGIVALDGVSFDVESGHIVGLIGPNGAGKTTLFNCLSRLYIPNSGDIHFKGQSILAQPRHAIPELGIGRTFQNVALFDRMSVLNNVKVGCHSRTTTGFFTNALRLPHREEEERRITERALELISFMDLKQVAHLPAGGLPFPVKKRVELARALAAEPTLLLLDEPMAGMNQEEKEYMARFILDARDERGVTVMLIEHHMDIIVGICDRMLVLSYGEVIDTGVPRDVIADPRVIKAYLGGAHAAA